MAISAVAGKGRPVCLPRTTSIGSPRTPPAQANSLMPYGIPSAHDGHEQERIRADDDHDRAALAAIEVLLADQLAVLARG